MNLVPCWWVGWWLWHAGKTPIYFIFYTVQATAKICNSYFEPLFGYFTVLNHCAPPPLGTFRNKNVTFCHFPIFYKSKIFLFRMDDLKNTAFLRFNSRAAPLTPFCKHYEWRKLFYWSLLTHTCVLLSAIVSWGRKGYTFLIGTRDFPYQESWKFWQKEYYYLRAWTITGRNWWLMTDDHMIRSYTNTVFKSPY